MAKAAAELAALGIKIRLDVLHAEAEAHELVTGWLAALEASRPALTEHKYAPEPGLHDLQSSV